MVNHTADQIRQLLLADCKLAGSQKEWAQKNGVSGSYVTDVLLGRREPGESILKILGYEKHAVYRKQEKIDMAMPEGAGQDAKKKTYVVSKRELGLAKNRIRSAVRLALAGKVLTGDNCKVCRSKEAAVAHHDNYNRPLDIRWMCNRCHRKWHAKYEAIDPDPETMGLSSYDWLVVGLNQHPEINYPPSLIRRNPRMQRKRRQENT